MKKDPQLALATAKPTKLRLEHLTSLEPITANQRVVFESYKKDYHMVLSGSAGSGKTFLSMFLALEQVLDKNTPYDKLIIVRSVVPTRDIGFLPGTKEEKEDVYTQPYISIAHELFEDKGAYEKLVTQNALEFLTTSYIRGTTLRNAIVLVDEMQNLNFHELDSIITRIGDNCRFIMCGDYYQTDFEKKNDKDGIIRFLRILDEMKRFKHVEFTWKDIVRSDLVREYIMTKEMLALNS
jgi:phosphate starvation-inducible PhoH-like protein|tara:strand:- start:1721 stop:2434 length:714 start_codon:yes stop_codon:yes gene_type:complete